ncbi:MAG: aldehyde dehydrogenase family protein [Pseudomonadota bacterium]
MWPSWLSRAGFPSGVLNVVNGYGASVGAALAAHPGVDKISFTGSTEVGRAILTAAAGNLKKVSLELGGKSPVIIFDDADLELAIPGAAMAAFFLQGQNCMAGTRLFVQRRVHDRVVSGLEAFAKTLKVGPAIAPDTALGPLISRAHLERVMSYVRAGREEGAELVTGGRRVGTTGNFLEPTVFANTTSAMRIVREEIFGPVLSIQAFDGDDLDALGRRVNDTDYGLSGSVWTTNLSRAHRMAHLVRAGQVSVNCHSAVDIGIPFGGYKQSGWGREYGQAALDLYTETKAVIVRI